MSNPKQQNRSRGYGSMIKNARLHGCVFEFPILKFPRLKSVPLKTVCQESLALWMHNTVYGPKFSRAVLLICSVWFYLYPVWSLTKHSVSIWADGWEFGAIHLVWAKTENTGAEELALRVECLLLKYEGLMLSSIPMCKLGMVVHGYNLSTLEVDITGLAGQLV